MGKAVLGIAAGILVAFATMFAINLAGHQIYPLPSDLNLNDPQAVGAAMRAMPPGAFAFVLIAWFVGALDGGVVAAAISRRAWTVWPVAAIVAAAGIVVMLMIPHPALLQIGAAVAPLLGGFAASLAAHRMFRNGG
jgi:hypothetical protein